MKHNKHTFSKILFVFCLIIAKTSFSQNKTVNPDSIFKVIDGRYTVEKIVSVENIAKNNLYQKGLRWLVMTYRSANNVIQLQDSTNGEIIGKGNLNTICWNKKIDVEHTIDILFKDGRFKVIVNQLIITIHNSANGIDYPHTEPIETLKLNGKDKLKLYTAVNDEIEKLINDLTNSMQSESKAKEDW
jgi:hypothetical protein